MLIAASSVGEVLLIEFIPRAPSSAASLIDSGSSAIAARVEAGSELRAIQAFASSDVIKESALAVLYGEGVIPSGFILEEGATTRAVMN